MSVLLRALTKYERDLSNPFAFLFTFIIRPLEDPWNFGDKLFTEFCVLVSHMGELLTKQDMAVTFASSEGIISVKLELLSDNQTFGNI
jgi:hypothetical protein